MPSPTIATITTYLDSCTREEEAEEQVDRLDLRVPVSEIDDSHEHG